MDDYTDHPDIMNWLDECRTKNTKEAYTYRINSFFNWYSNYLTEKNQPTNTPVETYLSLENRDKRHIALLYQNSFDGKNNTNCAIITALSSFLTYMDMPINWKRKRRKFQPDTSSHEFTTDDLHRMFQVADTKGKTLLALGASLGWEISPILELDRGYLKKIVAKAKSEKLEYFYFQTFREKTGAYRLGVLNPLAIDYLDQYLKQTEGKKPRKRRPNKNREIRPVSNVFDMTMQGVNNYLQKLANDARIVTTGRVHWHKIRGWVMSCLSRAGMNEFQIKYVVGKTIPMADSTYLQTLKLEIEERYPEAYEMYINISRPFSDKVRKKIVQSIETKDREMTEIKTQLQKLQETVKMLLDDEEKLDSYRMMITHNKKNMPKLKKIGSTMVETANTTVQVLENQVSRLQNEINENKTKIISCSHK
jgi:hypothetical protein